jgi:hypothetical protein
MTLIIALASIGLFSLGLAALWKLNKDFLLLWNANTIDVTADSPLDGRKAKIEFGISVNTISRKNDLDLFKDRQKYTTLYDGTPKDEMLNEYGENDFLITYDNKYYLSFRHFKFNRRHQHDYYFHFFKKSDNVFIRSEIKGKDAMRFERRMIPIDSAQWYVCNTPVDSAGDIYNMVDMKLR